MAGLVDAFADHSNDKGYVDRLLNLVNDEGFIALDAGEKEINLLKVYSSNPDFASDIDKLMASKGYNDVGGLQRVAMLDAMVRHSSDKGYVDRLLKLVNDEGFIALNDGNKEISLVKAYSRYPAFAVNVDKLMASKGYQDAGGQTRAAMLDALQSHANMFAFAPWLSHKGFTDRLYKVVNSNGFIALNDPVKETALVKAYGKSSSFATNFDEVMATSKDLKFDEFMMLDPEKQPRLDGTKMLVWNGEDEPMIFRAKKTSDHNYQVTLNGSQSFDVKFDPTPKFPEEAYVLGLADWYSEQSPRTRGGLKTVQFNGEDSDGALARGGNGTITFYGGTKNYDKGIFEHEMGHIAATLLDNQQPTDLFRQDGTMPSKKMGAMQ